MKEIVYRHTVAGVGVYESVSKICPLGDPRRDGKPDGEWLPKAGPKYPGALSFWTEYGIKKYIESGLRDWHQFIVEKPVELAEFDLGKIEVLYRDDFQVVGHLVKSGTYSSKTKS